jgi:hypothetical protein
MRREVRRWAEFPFNDSPFEVANYHMFRLKFFVGDAAGLDGYEPFFPIDTAGVAEGV